MIHGYARVSTPAQSLAAQAVELRRAGCDRVWEEVASGADDTRPVLGALLDYARVGDVLVVTAFDRLGRSVHHMVQLAGDLSKRGIQLRSLRDAIDTTTAAGHCFFTIAAAFAELELGIRRERQAAAWAAGKTKGRPPSLTTAQVQHAQRLRAQGHTLEQVAELLGSSRSTVQRALAVAALPPASWAGPDGLPDALPAATRSDRQGAR